MMHGSNALNPAWADKFYAAVSGMKERDAINAENQTVIYDNKAIVRQVTDRIIRFLER